MMKVLFKDRFGNKLIERSDKRIGLINASEKYCTYNEIKAFIKENRLSNKIKFKTRNKIWISENLL